MTNRDLKAAKELVDRLLNIYRSGIQKDSESSQKLIAGVAELIADERDRAVLLCKICPMTTPYNIGVAIEYAAQNPDN